MSVKSSPPYQPLLLRILHGLTGLCAIAALVTAFWTYNTYDGRWGTIPLPEFQELALILPQEELTADNHERNFLSYFVGHRALLPP